VLSHGVPLAPFCLIRSSGGLNSQPLHHDASAAANQPLLFRGGSDRASLLESFRSALSSSSQQQFGRVGGYDEPPLWSDQTRQGDLPMVAEEESSDDGDGAGHRADARDYDSGERRVGSAVAASCEHCHCSVCRRSLEQHQCRLRRHRSQNSSSSGEHEPPPVSDDAGGNNNNNNNFTLCDVFKFRNLQPGLKGRL